MNTASIQKQLVREKTNKRLEGKSACVFLNTYYGNFLDSHYGKYSQLKFSSYKQQLDSLHGAFFGDSDFYSKGMKKAGWDSEDLIINCLPLQQAWAKENGFCGEDLEIAVEQIRRLHPQVLYVQNLNALKGDFLSAIRPYVRLIVGQIATPIVNEIPFVQYDMIFSSFPHFVERFRQLGITSYYQPLAFDPCILGKFQNNQRSIACSFVGGISKLHMQSYKLLELLANETPTQFWGYGTETLPEDSAIHCRYHGQAWGVDMFSIFSSSKITINRHGEVAENYANNMRLFEATGCGAMLITDYKDNLNELFEIGKEIVAYRDAEEAVSLIKYYSRYPEEAEKIALAGQRKTLSEHTYAQRMKHTAEILERHLRYGAEKNCFPEPDMSKISYGLTPIHTSEISKEMTNGWQSEEIPARQRALTQQELRNMYKGKPPLTFQVLVDILRPYVFSNCSILEIGCSTGYYYEILEYLLNKRIAYTGVDYSVPLISMAQDYYPNAEFVVADGANLPFDDNEFFTVISSCVLLHVPNYRQHIAETARVAKQQVVAHRTPVCRRRPTQYFKKFAYGVETVELRFNEKEIVSEFTSNGLKLINALEYNSNHAGDKYEVTYLFRKQKDCSQ